MPRGIHISIALIAVVLLVRAFDYFAIGASSQKAADCCLKGKCAVVRIPVSKSVPFH